VFSDFLTPEINALFSKHMKNIGGKLKIKQAYEGSMIDVIAKVQQVCFVGDIHSIQQQF
jgi:U3 small nucleolar RNA-associated protein 25